jgi:F-type H+-transporting ATPase subunit b
VTFFSSNKLVASRKLIFALLVGGLLLAPAVRLRAQDVAPASVAHDAQSPSSAQSSAAQSSGGSRRELEEDETKEYRQSDSVKKVGALLGLSPENSAMAFEVFNFVVMALLLGWVIAKNLPKTFRNRSSAIQKDLVDARIATEEAGLRLSGVEARLAKLDDQIADLRAQAEKDSALDEQRIKASVEEEKQKIIAAAEQEIASATTQARRDIQRYAAELAIEQAARKLVVTAETDRLLVQGFARRLTGDDSKGDQN